MNICVFVLVFVFAFDGIFSFAFMCLCPCLMLMCHCGENHQEDNRQDSRQANFHNWVKTFIQSDTNIAIKCLLQRVWTVQVLGKVALLFNFSNFTFLYVPHHNWMKAWCTEFSSTYVLFTWGRPLRLANVKLFLRGWTIAIRCYCCYNCYCYIFVAIAVTIAIASYSLLLP